MSVEGYLITCAHVVTAAKAIKIKVGTNLLAAVLVKSDSKNDLALLRVQGRFQPLSLAISSSVRLGDSAFTIGFPNTYIQGFEPKLTRGEISSLAGLKDDLRYFQISVAVQPGNSGGPLVDQHGNVIGVVTLRMDDLQTLRLTGALPQNVNYALKVSYLTAFLSNLPEVHFRIQDASSIRERRIEEVVKEVQSASAIVFVY